ncbi:disulfide bond formation protein B, partial [Mycobacterium tuberculosis]|nr:disulfide bond formation protein B [Mycobacterium tuberculosis]
DASLTHSLLSYRRLAGLLTLASIIGMSFAYFYLQGVVKLDPCPLCIFQRVGLIVMGIFAFIAFLLNPKQVWAKILFGKPNCISMVLCGKARFMVM